MSFSDRLKNMFDGRTVFLVSVALSYVVAFVFAPEKASEAVGRSVDLLVGVTPALVLVFLLMAFSGLFLDEKRVQRIVGKGSGVGGWILSVFGGVLSSGPIYLWYPLLSDLRDRGMREGFLSAFLLARAVKLPLLPVMAFSFGWAFTSVFSLLLLSASFLGGMMTERILAKPERKTAHDDKP